MKIRPVGAEFLHADGQTDTVMTKLIVTFRNFANAPKKRAVAWKEIGLKRTKENKTHTYVWAAGQLQFTATVYLVSSRGIRHYSGAVSAAAGLYIRKHVRCDPQGISVW